MKNELAYDWGTKLSIMLMGTIVPSLVIFIATVIRVLWTAASDLEYTNLTYVWITFM